MSISKAVNPLAFQEANEIVDHSENGRQALDINYEQLRFRPAPAVRNLAATEVDMERRPVTPNLNDIVNGIFSGQIDDPQAAAARAASGAKPRMIERMVPPGQ